MIPQRVLMARCLSASSNDELRHLSRDLASHSSKAVGSAPSITSFAAPAIMRARDWRNSSADSLDRSPKFSFTTGYAFLYGVQRSHSETASPLKMSSSPAYLMLKKRSIIDRLIDLPKRLGRVNSKVLPFIPQRSQMSPVLSTKQYPLVTRALKSDTP